MNILFFFACSLSSQDAQTVLLSLYQPVLDIAKPCISNSELDSELEESLQLGSNWEGSLTAKGIREDYDSAQHYALTVSFEEVYVTTGDLTFNGSPALYMEYSIDLTDSASTTQKMTFSEELKVSGDVSGTATLNFTLIETYDAQTELYDVTVSGDISGADVSTFLEGGTP